MPFKSKAQQGYMFAHPDILGLAGLREWSQATKDQKGGFKALPKHVKQVPPQYRRKVS